MQMILLSTIKQMSNRHIGLQTFGFENLDPVSYPGKEVGIIQFKNCQLYIASAIKKFF